MIHKKSLLGGIVIGIVFTITGTLVFEFFAANNTSLTMPLTVNGKISRIYSLLDEHFIYDYDKKELEEGMYYGMLAMAGDSYTTYTDRETTILMNERYSGYYAGIGITIDIDKLNNKVLITEVLEGSPAEAAGIMIGDEITSVDGVLLADSGVELVGDMVRGEAGTSVVVTVYRKTAERQIDFTITRDVVNIPTIKDEMLENNIGYIEISRFDNATPRFFKEAYNELLELGMQSLIIDLRDNPGGSLGALVQIGDFLVDSEYLLYTEDKKGERHYYYGNNNKAEVPIVVLINAKSASAAELLAAILRERGGALLVGETTYGKGSVQTHFTLPDGSSLYITTAKYYTPNGVSVQGTGVEPDYAIEDKDTQLQKAIELAANA